MLSLLKQITLLAALWVTAASAASDFVDVGSEDFEHLSTDPNMDNPSTIIAKGFEISSVSDEYSPDHRHHHVRKLQDDACDFDPVIFDFEFIVILRPWNGVFDSTVAAIIESVIKEVIGEGACGPCLKLQELIVTKQLAYLPEGTTRRSLQGGLKQGWSEGRVVGTFSCASFDCLSLRSLFGDRRRLRGTVDMVDRRLQTSCGDAVRDGLAEANPAIFGGICEVELLEFSPACNWKDSGVQLFRR